MCEKSMIMETNEDDDQSKPNDVLLINIYCYKFYDNFILVINLTITLC